MKEKVQNETGQTPPSLKYLLYTTLLNAYILLQILHYIPRCNVRSRKVLKITGFFKVAKGSPPWALEGN